MSTSAKLSGNGWNALAWVLCGLFAASGAAFLGYRVEGSVAFLTTRLAPLLGLASAVFAGTISAILAGRWLDRRRARKQAVSYIRAVMNTVVFNSVILYSIRWRLFSWITRLDTQLFDATTLLRFEYLRNQDAIDALGILHHLCVAINAAFDKAIDTTLAEFRSADATPSDTTPAAANARHLAGQFVEDLQRLGKLAEEESLECLELLRGELKSLGHVAQTIQVPDFDKPPVNDDIPYRQLW